MLSHRNFPFYFLPRWAFNVDSLWQASYVLLTTPDSKVHGANLGPPWARQDPGGPHMLAHEPCYLGEFWTAPESLTDLRAHWLWQLRSRLSDCDCQHLLYRYALTGLLAWVQIKVLQDYPLTYRPNLTILAVKLPSFLADWASALHCWNREISCPAVGPTTGAPTLPHNIGCCLQYCILFAAAIWHTVWGYIRVGMYPLVQKTH